VLPSGTLSQTLDLEKILLRHIDRVTNLARERWTATDRRAAAASQIALFQRPEDIDRLLHCRRPAADASSVTLSADVGS